MNSINATFLFADGVSAQMEAQPGELLTEIAKRNGLTLFSDCNIGQCGTCTAKLISGSVDLDQYDSAVLPDDDRADGAILTCVARLKGACVVEFQYDSADASVAEIAPFAGTVAAITPVAEEIWQLEVDIDAPLDFMPGQYLRIRTTPEAPWRSYSMANAPGATRLSFYIRLVPNGAFSTWLQNGAKAGDRIELDGPRGHFFLMDEVRPRLFIAGGSGLAPFLSMLRNLQIQGDGQPTTLVIGGRSGAHLFAMDELAAMARANPMLKIAYAVEANPTAGAHTGYPTDLIPDLKLTKAERVYVCGPPPMVDAVKRAMDGIGLEKDSALYERFN